MKIALGPPQKRRSIARVVAAVLAAVAPLFSACSSHHAEDTYSGAAGVKCGGKESITASGSTAQANAMTLFISGFQKACQGQTLTYAPNGSGAGINEFTGYSLASCGPPADGPGTKFR
jgi:phosphate transport system substrate-binding protein